jgi:DNA polymerase III subunit beta
MTEQMHFIVENEALAKAMTHLQGIVRTVTTIPILTHVAVTAGDKEILVRANNPDREAEARLPAEVIQAGAAALPGEVVQALAKRLTKGGQCEVSLVGDRAHLVAGSSNYELRTLPIADFPERKSASEPVEFSLSAAELRAMIKSVAYAAAYRKSDRYYLQGVNLHVSGEKLIAVATDGVRLAVKSSPLPDGAAGMPRVTVPTEAASAMVDLLKDVEGDVELAVCPHLIELRLPDLRLASSLIDGTFPDYQRIMPAINGAAATFRVCALAEAVARVGIVRLSDVNKRAPILRLTTRDGTICLEAGAAGGEQALETVEAQTNGCSLSFGVAADYLAEMLDAWPRDAELGVQQSAPSNPILFMADERPSESHLIMPSVLKS